MFVPFTNAFVSNTFPLCTIETFPVVLEPSAALTVMCNVVSFTVFLRISVVRVVFILGTVIVFESEELAYILLDSYTAFKSCFPGLILNIIVAWPFDILFDVFLLFAYNVTIPSFNVLL